MKYILFIFSSLMIFWACDGDICPPDKKVGELGLTTTTQSFNPYNLDSRITFKSDAGDSLTFEATAASEVSFDQLCVKKICTEPEIKGNTTCEYFEAEAERIILATADQNALIDFLLYSSVIEENSKTFFQAMRIGFSQVNFIEQAGIITDSVDVENLNNLNYDPFPEFEFVGSITLNEQTFENAFQYEGSLVSLYYNQSKGLIGFKTPEATWDLVE